MKPVKLVLIQVLAALLGLSVYAQSDIYSTVKIYPPADLTQRAQLLGWLQVDHFQETEGAIIVEINASEIARLKATGYRFEILIGNLSHHLDSLNQKFYATRTLQGKMAFEQTGSVVDDIIATPSAFVVQPTFGGYYSFAQMEAAMDALVAAYPTLVQKTSLGTSHQGRDIWCIKISDNVATDESSEPEVLYMGLQHAREAIGGSSMIFFMQYLCETYGTDSRIKDLVDNREIFIIPCMNPDGWEYNRNNGGAGAGWRKNRRNNGSGFWGVDLNRNWSVDWSNCSAPIVGSPTSCGSSNPGDDTYYGPSSFSEPETQAVRDFTYAHHLVAMIDQHSYGPYYSLPFGRPSLPSNVMPALDQQFYDYIASAMGTYNGMRAGNSPQALGYEVAGGVKDWMLKGNIGTGSKSKVYGMTGEGGAGGGTGGTYGSFWAPAAEIVNLCKGMTYQNLQLLYAAGSYVNLQDKSDVELTSKTGNFDFHLTRVGLDDQPVDISLVPIENIQSVGSTATVSSLPNYYDTHDGSISYVLPAALGDGQRIRFAWKVQTGGYTWYDTVTKFYNPTVLFSDDMEGSSVATNWTVTSGWNYTTEDAYAGSKSLAESPGGNYTANSTRRATYTGTLNLSDASAAWMSFWVKQRAENFHDKLQVQVSSNGGTTWTAIAGSTTIQEPGTLDGSTINGRPALTGVKDTWTRELFDLSAYTGVAALRLRFEFTSDAAAAYDFSEDDGFHIDNIKIIKSTAALVTLPVQFISVTGRLLPNQSIRIDWQAIVDEQHDYFEVEKSADGLNFRALQRGPAAAPYFLNDPAPWVGNNYYRIRQVDKDGKVSYSQTVLVIFNPASLIVSLYPNPARDAVTVRLNTLPADRYTVSVADLAGKRLWRRTLQVGADQANQTSIDLRPWSAGVYVLTVQNSAQAVIATTKLAKN